MRIVLPCATIAAITSAWGLVSADRGAAAADAVEELDAADGGGDIALARSRAFRSRDDAEERTHTSSPDIVVVVGRGEECDILGDYGGLVTKADVGVLHCGHGRTCEADATSSAGGRCVAARASSSSSSSFTSVLLPRDRAPPRAPVFPSRSSPALLRRLQDSNSTNSTAAGDEFVCPTNCPKNFCDCARGQHSDGEGGDAFKCAPELHSTCINELIPECVPEDTLTFYTETYCPFAACVVVSGDSYENCTCEYYNDYCRTYYAFEESLDKCAIGTCCDSQPEGNKFVCLPELAPTGTPTLQPTDTFGPTGTPTISAAPTTSPKPTVSPPPSSSPTISSAPTVSPAPTAKASEAPSAAPTVSPEPTNYPTGSPTITARPTVSPAPTASPSISSSPTISPAPTVSHSPSAAPSFAPTGSPQGTPTGEPSDSPIATPMPTDEEPPADEEEEVVVEEVDGADDADIAEVVEKVSGGPATRPVRTAALAASLFLGAVGAFWTVA